MTTNKVAKVYSIYRRDEQEALEFLLGQMKPFETECMDFGDGFTPKKFKVWVTVEEVHE